MDEAMILAEKDSGLLPNFPKTADWGISNYAYCNGWLFHGSGGAGSLHDIIGSPPYLSSLISIETLCDI
jgi:hypothetical protein